MGFGTWVKNLGKHVVDAGTNVVSVFTLGHLDYDYDSGDFRWRDENMFDDIKEGFTDAGTIFEEAGNHFKDGNIMGGIGMGLFGLADGALAVGNVATGGTLHRTFEDFGDSTMDMVTNENGTIDVVAKEGAGILANGLAGASDFMGDTNQYMSDLEDAGMIKEANIVGAKMVGAEALTVAGTAATVATGGAILEGAGVVGAGASTIGGIAASTGMTLAKTAAITSLVGAGVGITKNGLEKNLSQEINLVADCTSAMDKSDKLYQIFESKGYIADDMADKFKDITLDAMYNYSEYDLTKPENQAGLMVLLESENCLSPKYFEDAALDVYSEAFESGQISENQYEALALLEGQYHTQGIDPTNYETFAQAIVADPNVDFDNLMNSVPKYDPNSYVASGEMGSNFDPFSNTASDEQIDSYFAERYGAKGAEFMNTIKGYITEFAVTHDAASVVDQIARDKTDIVDMAKELAEENNVSPRKFIADVKNAFMNDAELKDAADNITVDDLRDFVSAVKDKQDERNASLPDVMLDTPNLTNISTSDLAESTINLDSAMSGSVEAVNAFGVPIESASADVFKAPFDFSDMQEDIPEMEPVVHEESRSVADNIVEDEQPKVEEEPKSNIYPIFEA